MSVGPLEFLNLLCSHLVCYLFSPAFDCICLFNWLFLSNGLQSVHLIGRWRIFRDNKLQYCALSSISRLNLKVIIIKRALQLPPGAIVSASCVTSKSGIRLCNIGKRKNSIFINFVSSFFSYLKLFFRRPFLSRHKKGGVSTFQILVFLYPIIVNNTSFPSAIFRLELPSSPQVIQLQLGTPCTFFF